LISNHPPYFILLELVAVNGYFDLIANCPPSEKPKSLNYCTTKNKIV